MRKTVWPFCSTKLNWWIGGFVIFDVTNRLKVWGWLDGLSCSGVPASNWLKVKATVGFCNLCKLDLKSANIYVKQFGARFPNLSQTFAAGIYFLRNRETFPFVWFINVVRSSCFCYLSITTTYVVYSTMGSKFFWILISNLI